MGDMLVVGELKVSICSSMQESCYVSLTADNGNIDFHTSPNGNIHRVLS